MPKVKRSIKLKDRKKKAKKLANSREIYAWRVSDYPEVKTALRLIFEKMEGQGLIRKQNEKKYKDHIPWYWRPFWWRTFAAISLLYFALYVHMWIGIREGFEHMIGPHRDLADSPENVLPRP